MRGYDPEREQRFFAVLDRYYDLERNTSRRFSSGEYTLERMQPLARLAGDPQDAVRVVHVSGTKGKGSTCHLIAALLKASGLSCGLFASPHLATVRERFQIDGELVDYERLIAAAEAYAAALRRADLTPTLFEIFTVLALKLFADAGVDIAILETGIGGRLDATNFVAGPVCCAVTAVSFDHMQLLGNTIEKIATEKAGIIKPGVPVGIGRQPYPEAEVVIRQRAKQLQAPVFGPANPTAVEPFVGQRCLPPFLRENIALALAVAGRLGATPDVSRFAFPEMRARCEIVSTHPLVILDAAHNADSMRRLVEALQSCWQEQDWTVVLGVVQGKDCAGILRALEPLGATLVLTDPHTPKPSALEELRQQAEQQGRDVRIIRQLERSEQLPPAKAYVFTGSFFTALIGEKLFGQ